MIIFMISRKHSAEMVEVRKENYVSDKPMVVVDYKRGKCAVDLSDQMIVYFTPPRVVYKISFRVIVKYINFKRDDTL